MPLGDSNTEGVASFEITVENRVAYRDKLEELLDASKLKGLYDFVGSERTGGSLMHDTEHAGFGGARDEDIAELLRNGKFEYYNTGDYHGPGLEPGYAGYLDMYDPDIILLHIGTNEAWKNPGDVSEVVDILDQIDAYEDREKKDVTVILAKIILSDGRDPSVDTDIITYNNAVSEMVKTRVEAGDLLVQVDMQEGAGLVYESAEAGGDMADQLHLTPGGYAKMAQVWFDAIMSTNAVLPVELMEFKAVYKGGQVQLKWSTASEQDNARFEVERMQEEQPFVTIGAVAGAGNSSSLLRYTYPDAAAPAGQLYYRLKQVDSDGTYSYSNVIAVSLPGAIGLTTKIYPNPTDGTAAVYLSASGFMKAAPVELTLRDAKGRKLFYQTLRAGTQGILNAAIPLPQGLAQGFYIGELTSSVGSRRFKLLVR
ncbi:hypothetical protein GCM10023188_32880 [Pontibacter saemangeumensis]|uniref:Por secretion system C-terminal sorting domain-containing protein n=1 Tax=Pontibacter saemangeumensis TaxID=1084525 RepID=A0ABP8LVI1_9BACT